jgi:hypothetical protein
VQLYSALVYRGLSLVGDILRGLDALLARDGFAPSPRPSAPAAATGCPIWLVNRTDAAKPGRQAAAHRPPGPPAFGGKGEAVQQM